LWPGRRLIESRPRIFVDAKIIGRHEQIPRNSFVAYVSEDFGVRGFARVNADQTDEAEFEAVAFAIKELKGKLAAFTIMCDNESVVSQIARGLHRPSSRPIFSEILAARKANPGIEVEFFGKNPAHSLLNKEIARLQKEESSSI
jgi:ribonuclease HI